MSAITSIDNNLFNRTGSVPDGTRPVNKDVARSEELLESFASERNSHANTFWENNQFRNGVQLTDKQKRVYQERKQSPVAWDMIGSTIEAKKALLTDNSPRYQVTSREDSDVNSVYMINDSISYVWQISKGDGELKAAVDDVCVGGLGFMMSYVDPRADWGKGEVYVANVSYLDVYVDPNSKDRLFRDASDILVARRMTEAQVIAFMPKAKTLIKSGRMMPSESSRYPGGGYTTDIEESGRFSMDTIQLSVPDTASGVTYYEVIDRYTKIEQKVFRVFDPFTNYEEILNKEQYDVWLSQPAFIVETLEGRRVVTDAGEVTQYLSLITEVGDVFHFMPGPEGAIGEIMPGPEHEGAIPGSTHVLTQTTNSKLLKQKELASLEVPVNRIQRVVSAGQALLHKEILNIDEYPIVPFMEGHNRNPFPVAVTTKAKPVQEHLNKTKSLLMAYLANATNVKVIIGKGTQNKEEVRTEMSKAGAAVIEVDFDLGPAPVILAPVSIPANAYVEVQDARGEIERMYGVFSFGQGDPSAAPEVFQMGLLLDEHQGRRIGSQLKDFYESLDLLAKVTVQQVQSTYTERKVIRLFNPNNEPVKTVTLNDPVYDEYSRELVGRINDVTLGAYDVVTVAGSTLPTQRWMEREYYFRLYKEGVGDEEMVLRKSDIRDVDKILERKAEKAQLVRLVKDQNQTIKDLEGTSKRKDSEIVHLRQDKEVKNFETSLDKEVNRIHSATLLYEERLNDVLKQTRQQALA